MSGLKISEAAIDTNITGNELIPIADGMNAKAVRTSDLANYSRPAFYIISDIAAHNMLQANKGDWAKINENQKIYFYDGSNWINIKTDIPSFLTNPNNPNDGQIWYNSNEKKIRYFDNTNIQSIALETDLLLLKNRFDTEQLLKTPLNFDSKNINHLYKGYDKYPSNASTNEWMILRQQKKHPFIIEFVPKKNNQSYDDLTSAWLEKTKLNYQVWNGI